MFWCNENFYTNEIIEHILVTTSNIYISANFEKTIKNTHLYNLIIEEILFIYNPNDGENIVFKGEDNIIYQIISLKNELELLKHRSNNIDNLSIIDFGKWEVKF